MHLCLEAAKYEKNRRTPAETDAMTDGMTCNGCGATVRATSRFCEQCGAKLDHPCPSCGAETSPGARFCAQCGASLAGPRPASEQAPFRGANTTALQPRAYTPKHLAEKILHSRSALEGERKQMSVLFVDLKGSMDLAEQSDPEEWHAIMDRFFSILAGGVHRFEGTINQYTGDGIMALFGAPIAHEDHAQRACWTALHLNEELRRYANELRVQRGVSVNFRMGINSGEVVVGKIGDDLRMDYTAQGHTVGLAARMEQLAEPGAIYLTQYTARLVDGYFRMQDLGASNVKGVRAPLHVYVLEGVGPLKTRLDVSRQRGFSRFVGRQDEMAALDAGLSHAIAGRGRVVGVVAEPGVGKSRLCYEFVQRCRARGIAVNEAQAVSHGKHVPFLPILELLRGYFGIGEQDSSQIAREKIAGRLLLLDEGLRDSLPLVFDFLGVPDPERPSPRIDPEALQRQLSAIIRRAMQARSRREPQVTLIEDLHWLDGGSETFLEMFVELAPEGRNLFLLNFRPEYHAAWMQRSYYQQVPLMPLGPEAVAELVRSLLGTDPSVTDLAGLIEARTSGNPFFVEEMVQSLLESGHLDGPRGAHRLLRPIEDVGIPNTVQALLAGRIDRLVERDKQVLQTAAVIGMEFTNSVLRSVAALPQAEIESALRSLKEKEFLFERELYPEVEYTFKHPLTREVAYQSQLADRRTAVHAAVARVIVEQEPEKLGERAALVAHHWEAAGEPLEAARWSRRAAEWIGSKDSAEAMRHWEKVRALLLAGPDSPETVALALQSRVALLDVGWRRGVTEEQATRLFDEGRALAARSPDPTMLALLVNRYATVRGTAGAVTEYFHLAAEAMRLAEGSDSAFHAALRLSTAYPYFLVGRLNEALAIVDDYLTAAPGQAGWGLEAFNPSVFAHWFRTALLFEMGRIVEGRQGLDAAERLAREQNETEILGWVHYGHATSADLTLDLDGALGHARQSLEIALKIGSGFSLGAAYSALATVHVLRGEWEDSVRVAEEHLASMRELRTGLEQQPGALTTLAQAHLGRGDVARARSLAEEAVALARQMETLLQELRAQLALARVLCRADGVVASDAIEAALARAFAIASETGARRYEPLVHLERAELARLRRDEDARRRELVEARRLFAEMGATARAEQVEHELIA